MAGVVGDMAPLQTNQSSLNRPIVLCGPSGVGKGTLTAMLFKDWGQYFARKISHTTRAPRPHEVNGVDYHFVTREAFEADIARHAFIEHALVHNNYYGTAISSVQAAMQQGKIVVLELDVQGVASIRAQAERDPANALHCLYLWIAPPTYDALADRLHSRGTDSGEGLKARLATAEKERAAVAERPDLFTHTLVNDELNECYYRLTQLIAQNYPHMAPLVEAKWAATPLSSLPAILPSSPKSVSEATAAAAAAAGETAPKKEAAVGGGAEAKSDGEKV